MSKNIVITGTSRGIGLELVHLFANAGHNVLALSRNQLPSTNMSADNIDFLPFDLTKGAHYKKVAAYVEEHWKQVDVVIHNAGMLVNKPFSKTTYKDFKKVYKVNVFGVAELTQTLLPFMHIDSHVVSISSMGGVQGSMKFPGLAAYSSSKGAVITLTELLAEEYKETGPKFNVLALGAVQTEMLQEAFPGYKAPVTAVEMAQYIFNFALTAHKLYNGKLLQVSSSTP